MPASSGYKLGMLLNIYNVQNGPLHEESSGSKCQEWYHRELWRTVITTMSRDDGTGTALRH